MIIANNNANLHFFPSIEIETVENPQPNQKISIFEFDFPKKKKERKNKNY